MSFSLPQDTETSWSSYTMHKLYVRDHWCLFLHFW